MAIATPFLIFDNLGAAVNSGIATGGTTVAAPPGALIVVSIAPSGTAISGLTDDAGNTYTLAKRQSAGASLGTELWRCQNSLHLPVGTKFTAGVTGGTFAVYSGVAAVAGANLGLDQTAGKNVTAALNFGPNIPIGPFAVGGELVFATLNFSNGFTTYTEDSGFTNLVPGFLSGNGTPLSYQKLPDGFSSAINWQPGWTGSSSNAEGVVTSFMPIVFPPGRPLLAT